MGKKLMSTKSIDYQNLITKYYDKTTAIKIMILT